ncbi:DUF4468 domain-containing protein [Pedobacter aquae]|uniref:DUF4468 domain-containing protein n=1 Tax=Pedobacter aquae TaxID=2605747 RepID=A0A5C0VLG7_9SPHI|nr:DUF4468 domain-containing protein [Pedobacter aquae]QEK52513.1 DUF4468 domain-containing protein [Pedobacter aquae]
MKKLLLFALLIAISFHSSGQSAIEKIELKANGFVGNDTTKNFVVIELPGKKKNDLYKSTLVYLSSMYKYPDKVLTIVDGESIIINGFTESIKGSLSWYKYLFYYRISIQFKDGKIKFEPSTSSLTEIWAEGKERKFYISSKDSPDPYDMNVVYIVSKGNQILINKEIKLSMEEWANSYLKQLIKGISKSDW